MSDTRKRIEAWIVVSVWVVALAALAATPSLGKKDAGSGTAQIVASETLYRAELLAPMDEPPIQADGLPQVKPFWVDMVDAEGLPVDGDGVYVAILDTGLLPIWDFFFSEADIATALGKGFTHDVTWDAGAGDFAFGPLEDDRGFITELASGHGTHVTSTVIGFNYNDIAWIQGVAPKATIIPVLVLDGWIVDTPDGLVGLTGGTDEMVAAGIYYVADLELDGPVIISMSLGGPEPTDMIEDAIDYAISQGCIVVASAGNEGYDGMGWPGAYPQVISCGAAGWTGAWVGSGVPNWVGDVPENLKTKDFLGNTWQFFLEDFSSRPNKALGQKAKDLDVCTPGASIVGPYKVEFTSNVGYYYLWGTSMSAPHVSGISALVLEDHPDYDQVDMETCLKAAAKGLPFPAAFTWAYDPVEWYFKWFGTDWGSGFLQADAALDKAK